MCLLLNRVDDVFCLMPETERRDGGWGRVELKAAFWWHCERGLERMGLLILNHVQPFAAIRELRGEVFRKLSLRWQQVGCRLGGWRPWVIFELAVAVVEEIRGRLVVSGLCVGHVLQYRGCRAIVRQLSEWGEAKRSGFG